MAIKLCQLVVICFVLAAGQASIIRPNLQSYNIDWTKNEEIEMFREYLRIPTVHPNVNYKPAVEFLKKQAAKLDLPVSIYYPVDADNPVVVMTWKGSQPELPSIMLNSHMDVVPVFPEYWTHPPFAAEIDEKGDIFARGAQDMKCVGMQYLGAIRALKRQGINQLTRTIYLTYVPDEEAGGRLGMGGFVQMDAFKEMNVAFALDEGGTNEGEIMAAQYLERLPWHLEMIIHGQSGHGSKLLDNTPGEKLNYVIGKLYEMRAKEKRKLKELKYPYGNVTSINLTRLKGGVANNVIPAELNVTVDIRLSANTEFEDFKMQLDRWCEEAGGNITIVTKNIGVKHNPTKVDDSNPFWVAFKKAVAEAGYKVQPVISRGSTDMKYVRKLNISAIGFSAMTNTISRQHDHNEYINANIYLKGIDIYKKVIVSLGNLTLEI